MDMLFKRYACPFLLLDGVIASSQLCDFLQTLEEVKKEEDLWEFYIHKIPSWDDRTFEEFKNGVNRTNTNDIVIPSDEELETTITESYEMIKNFKLN